MLFTIAKWKNGSKAAYSSTWDDACKSSLFELTDIANKYNILTTIYVNFDNKEWITESFYDEEYKNNYPNERIKKRMKEIHNAGNEIGNHTYSHIALNSDEHHHKIIDDILNCSLNIKAITNQDDFTLSYPWSRQPTKKPVIDFVNNNFVAARTAFDQKSEEDAYNYMNDTEDIFHIKSLHVGTKPYIKTSSELNRYLDNAIRKNLWLVEYGHGVNSDGWRPVNLTTMKEHFKYISKQDIWCDTIKNISKYIKMRDNIKLQLKKISETIYYLDFEISLEIIEKYYIPLTLCLNNNLNIKIVQNNKELLPIIKNGKKYYNIIDYSKCVIEILRF